jgi:hypothetical protein
MILRLSVKGCDGVGCEWKSLASVVERIVEVEGVVVVYIMDRRCLCSGYKKGNQGGKME